MSKILLIPNSLDEIRNLKSKVDGFILPIKGLSTNYNFYIDIYDINIILDELKGREIFISLNKNIHNQDLTKLKNILIDIDKYSIKGIMYYDVSVLQLKKELNLKTDLVWAADHLVTNYSTINYWYDEGVKYAYLASEITKNEILTIKNKSKSLLIMNIFGYIPIFTSKRPLITNYLNTFDKEKKSDIYYMYKEGISYPLIENNGTVAYSNYIFNGLKDYFDINLEYYVINSFLINDIEKVINIFNRVKKDNINELNDELTNLIPNTSSGFLYKETIYKVK